MDERAGALGRELTEAEIADILRRHGHPMAVAACFGPRHQVIGPAIFPFDAFALVVREQDGPPAGEGGLKAGKRRTA